MYVSQIKARLIPQSTHKLLSTQNGKIVIHCIEDIIIYAQTQGIFYWKYQQRNCLTAYFLRLAALMKSEGRNKLAALCYLHALCEAWRRKTSATIYPQNSSGAKIIDPHRIYAIARLHLLDIGSERGLKRLKKLHNRMREMAYFDRTVDKVLAESSFVNRVNSSLPEVADPEEEVDFDSLECK